MCGGFVSRGWGGGEVDGVIYCIYLLSMYVYSSTRSLQDRELRPTQGT